MLNEKQLAEKIYRLKRELEIYEEIYNSKSEGTGRPVGSLEYSDEEIEFLEENKNMHMKNLIPFFNRTFGTSYPDDSRALYNLMERQRIIKPASTNIITHNQIRAKKLKVGKLKEERRKNIAEVNKNNKNYRDKKIGSNNPYNNKYPKKNIYFADREKVKQLIHLNYFGTDADRENMSKFLEVENWSRIRHDLHGVRKRYNFLPSEFGLREFPNIRGSHVRKEIGRFLL